MSSCCSTNNTNPAVDGTDRENLLGGSSEDTATCPVMVGTPVVKAVAEAAGLYRDFEGQRYWFCCAGCGACSTPRTGRRCSPPSG